MSDENQPVSDVTLIAVVSILCLTLLVALYIIFG